MTDNGQRMFASDVGGTFTDLVVIESGDGAATIRTAKLPTTPPNFHVGVIDGVEHLDLDLGQMGSHVHGSTVVINAVTERKGARIGLIATEGFRDTLAIARGNRPDFFNLSYSKPEPLVPRYLRRELPGRLTYTGSVHTPLDLEPLDSILEDFRAANVESIAVCLLHSWVNPMHELDVSAAIAERWPETSVVISSSITREWREFERTSTAAMSAFVQPVAQRYLHRLDEELRQRGLGTRTLVMQSNCGLASVEEVAATPITMIESGPAAGFRGAALLGSMIGEPNVIALDIGGTTAKCSLIRDGEVSIVSDYWIGRNRGSAGHPVLVPVVDLVEIGAGGGSIAAVDAFGRLTVGPESAGASPGPASYGAGGTQATTTDANLWLGRISRDDFCGGSIEADLDAAEAALDAVGAALGTDASGAARAIVRIANNNMINALKLVSVNRGHDPRDFTMVAFGGGGPLHASSLARSLGMSRVVIPANAAVFSAWGMLTSDIRRDYFLTVLADVDAGIGQHLDEALTSMVAKARSEFEASGHPEPDCAWRGRFRYRGQEHASEVLFEIEDLADDSLPGLIDRFGAAYEEEYTYRLDAPVEIVGLHLVATADRGIELPAPVVVEELQQADAASVRSVDFDEDGVHDARIYALETLDAGMTFTGPAVAEGQGTAILVGPGCEVHLDGHRNVIIELPRS